MTSPLNSCFAKLSAVAIAIAVGIGLLSATAPAEARVIGHVQTALKSEIAAPVITVDHKRHRHHKAYRHKHHYDGKTYRHRHAGPRRHSHDFHHDRRDHRAHGRKHRHDHYDHDHRRDHKRELRKRRKKEAILGLFGAFAKKSRQHH